MANIAGKVGLFLIFEESLWVDSELADPQKLLMYLLQPSVANLPSDIIAVYIHAATKIFGYWASDLAERWDDDRLPDVKEIVNMVVEQVSVFTSSPYIEVQERVGVPSSFCG